MADYPIGRMSATGQLWAVELDPDLATGPDEMIDFHVGHASLNLDRRAFEGAEVTAGGSVTFAVGGLGFMVELA